MDDGRGAHAGKAIGVGKQKVKRLVDVQDPSKSAIRHVRVPCPLYGRVLANGRGTREQVNNFEEQKKRRD